jgi:hypothetical protein
MRNASKESVMTIEYPADAITFVDGRPTAVGEQRLGSPTQLIRTRAGRVWAVYGIGEEALVIHPGGAMRGPAAELSRRLGAIAQGDGRDGDDRQAAATLLELIGAADDSGRAAVPEPYGERTDVPRSVRETGLPPTYRLTGPYNRPGEPDPPAEPAPPRPKP